MFDNLTIEELINLVEKNMLDIIGEGSSRRTYDLEKVGYPGYVFKMTKDIENDYDKQTEKEYSVLQKIKNNPDHMKYFADIVKYYDKRGYIMKKASNFGSLSDVCEKLNINYSTFY